MKSLIANPFLTFILPIFLVSSCSSTQHKIADRLLEKWPCEIDQEIKKIDDRVVEGKGKDGLGTYYWKTDEYLKSPKAENLKEENFNEILRIVNAEYHLVLEKFLQKASFQLCSEKETAKLFKLLRKDEHKELPIVHLWKLEQDLYLLICHEGGSSGERSYTFFIAKNDKAIAIEEFSNPPDRQQIRKIATRIREMKCK